MCAIRHFVARHVRELYLQQTAQAQIDALDRPLPFASVDPEAIMLFIDISGYSKLTTELALTLGPSGASTLVSIINACIRKLLSIIFKYDGDVIKFAGDSVAVCWSRFSKSQEAPTQPGDVDRDVLRAVMCSYEILDAFQNYSVDMPELVEDRVVYRGRKSFLRVHCSMSHGQVSHLHFGVKGQRREYLLGGKAVSSAACSLDLAKSDEISLSLSTVRLLKTFGVEVKAIRLEENGEFYVLDRVQMRNLCKAKAIKEMGLLSAPPPASEETATAAVSRPIDPSVLNVYKEYVNESAVYLLDKGMAAGGNQQDVGDKINILRQVTVVFLKLQSFDTENAHLNMSNGQAIFELVLSAIKQYEGSLRQFNIDDKGGTALLVWGLPPFSHEKEPDFGVMAAISLRSQLTKLMGDKFSIGITTGAAFAGAIGDRSRKDHCILGLCVNEAARLMCNDLAHGTCLCDETTYLATKERFEYTEGNVIHIKGRDSAIEVYTPVRRQAPDTNYRSQMQLKETLYGREAELKLIKQSIETWYTANTRQVLSIVGESGQGKSALLKNALVQLLGRTDVVPCLGSATEVDKTTPYNAVRNVLASLLAVLASKVEKKTDSSAMPVASGPMLGSERDSAVRRSTFLTSQSRMNLDDATVGQSDVSRDVIWLWGALGQPYRTLPLLNNIFDVRFPESSETKCISGAELHNAVIDVVMNVMQSVKSLNLRLAICIDDMQWCDMHSWALFVKIAQELDNVFLCFTTRPEMEYTDEHSLTNMRSMHAFPMELTNLTKESMAAFFLGKAQQCGFEVQEVDAHLVQEVCEQTNGNAFVSSVLIEALLKSAFVKQAQNKLVPSGRFQSSMDSIASVISSQFDRLDKTFQEVLKVASAIGQYFSVEELIGVFSVHFNRPVRSEQASSIIQSLDRFRFLLPTGVDYASVIQNGSAAQPVIKAFGFRHIIIQQSVYSGMLFEERQHMHESILAYYQQLCGNKPYTPEMLPQLCYHLDKVPGREQQKFDLFEAFFFTLVKERHIAEASNVYTKLDHLLQRHQQLLQIDPARVRLLESNMAHIRMMCVEYKDALRHLGRTLELHSAAAPQSSFKRLKVIVADGARLLVNRKLPMLRKTLYDEKAVTKQAGLQQVYSRNIMALFLVQPDVTLLYYVLRYASMTREYLSVLPVHHCIALTYAAIVFRSRNFLPLSQRLFQMARELFEQACQKPTQFTVAADIQFYQILVAIYHMNAGYLKKALTETEATLTSNLKTNEITPESVVAASVFTTAAWLSGSMDKTEWFGVEFNRLLTVRKPGEVYDMFLSTAQLLWLTEKFQIPEALPWKEQLSSHLGRILQAQSGDGVVESGTTQSEKTFLLRASLALLLFHVAAFGQTTEVAWDAPGFSVALKCLLDHLPTKQVVDAQTAVLCFRAMETLALIHRSPILQQYPRLSGPLFKAVHDATFHTHQSSLPLIVIVHDFGRGLLAHLKDEPSVAAVFWNKALRRPMIEECRMLRAIIHEHLARFSPSVASPRPSSKLLTKVTDDDAHIALNMYRDMGARFRFAQLRKWLVTNSKFTARENSIRRSSGL